MSNIFNLKTMQHTNYTTTSFSGIDLQTRIDDTTTGIVFPFKNTTSDYHPSFSGIVKIKNAICYMAHSQYRIITNNPHTGYANYTLMPSVTFSKFPKQQTLLGKVLNKPEIIQEHVITDIDLTVESDDSKQDMQNIADFLNNILNGYCPVILIDNTHLTKKEIQIINEYSNNIWEEIENEFETLEEFEDEEYYEEFTDEIEKLIFQQEQEFKRK